MSRYDSTSQGKRFDGKRVILTTIYPQIRHRDDDIFIISSDSDRLDTLAFKFYKDPNLWWVIGQANHIGLGGFDVPPGMQLRIPRNVSEILSNLASANG